MKKLITAVLTAALALSAAGCSKEKETVSDKTQINDKEIMSVSEYKVIRSSRKTLAIEIKPKEGVIVRAPFGVSDGYIRRTVEQKRKWIESHMQKLHERTGASARKLTSEEIAKLYQKAAE